jgi:hypothetical protein
MFGCQISRAKHYHFRDHRPGLQKIIENKLNKIWWNGFNFISLLLLITNTKENESNIELEPISYH